MYKVSDKQIDYILDDIRRNGIELEDLQLNLLDHVCCIIEEQLEDDGNFEQFYHTVIRKFYKKELREIEVETIDLLTFKNYYSMKKMLIGSGTFSVFALVFGSFFKIMHWPGASILLTLGIASFSLLFLPLLFVLKAKEMNTKAEKMIAAVGSLCGILFTLALLFIVNHWPGANQMLFASISIAAFVLLPSYFFTGIRRPETKLNTILMSIILVGIIGLQFTLVRLRPSTNQLSTKLNVYANSEQLVRDMQSGLEMSSKGQEIYDLCKEIKAIILQRMYGLDSIPVANRLAEMTLNEGGLSIEFDPGAEGTLLLEQLKQAVKAYQPAEPLGRLSFSNHPILASPATKARELYTNVTMLNGLNQIQMYVALNEQRKTTAMK